MSIGRLLQSRWSPESGSVVVGGPLLASFHEVKATHSDRFLRPEDLYTFPHKVIDEYFL